jgi:hypothetical protein
MSFDDVYSENNDETEEDKATLKSSFTQDFDNMIVDEVKVSELYGKLIEKAGLLYGSDANIVRTLKQIQEDEVKHHNLIVELRNITV